MTTAIEITRTVAAVSLIILSGYAGFYAGTQRGENQIYSQLLGNMQQAVVSAGVKK